MTVGQLRAAQMATPFRPFQVHTINGRRFPVPHPDSLTMSSTGRTAAIHREGAGLSVLDLSLMTAIEILAASRAQA